MILALAFLTATGRGVVGTKVYADARTDKDAALKVALTAIDAASEMSGNVARLAAAVEGLTAAQRETTQVVRAVGQAVELLAARRVGP
jgi:formylmethanofuran:tetrahydromethanopterin formyltransferase